MDQPRTPPTAPAVRYYPRRMSRAGRRPPLSPSQALHLADDPARAASARSTSEHRDYVAPPPAPPPAQPQTPSRLRRWVSRLLRH